MAGHLSKIKIVSFKGIKNLCLENLAPINILTGDNNCGKTSVLEVIESLTSPSDFYTWRSLIRKEKFTSTFVGMSIFEGLINLFNVDDKEMRIRYEVGFIDGTDERIELTGKIEQENLTIQECQELTGMLWDDESEEELNLEDIESLTVSVNINDVKQVDYKIYDIQRRFAIDRLDDAKLVKVTYISPVRHAEGTLFLRSVLDNPELYEQMLQILQEFDPGIISINVDNANEKYRRGNVYKILSKEHSKALPLNVYGDGMKKAVLLMSAVIQSQGGILLLDEFETAIHTTAMNKVFEWILETCTKLDVQLFLTTHSEEAIDKVLKCSPKLQDKIKVFTLYKNEDGTIARAVDAYKAIEMKDEMGLELR